MSRLAIFVDGGYYSALAEKHYHERLDFVKFIEEIRSTVESKSRDGIDILRTFYYDCPPYQSNTPSDEEKRRYGAKIGFFNYLDTLPRVQVRKGRLAYRGRKRNGGPIYQQKRVDLLLGLDFADLSAKGQVSYIALVAGDSDFHPAVEHAKQEGVCVWLFHGPKVSPDNYESTYSEELWQCADERCEINQVFIDKIKRD
jgi:uncharacterized LabA/DUF88 family protein